VGKESQTNGEHGLPVTTLIRFLYFFSKCQPYQIGLYKINDQGPSLSVLLLLCATKLWTNEQCRL